MRKTTIISLMVIGLLLGGSVYIASDNRQKAGKWFWQDDTQKGLNYLSDAGIELDKYQATSLTKEKATDTVYLDTLVKLHKSGIKIDSGLIYDLSLKKAYSKIYLDSIMDLSLSTKQKYFTSFVEKISVEEINDDIYISTLIDLHSQGIELHWDILQYLTQEKAKNPKYIIALKKLNSAEIKITSELVNELSIEKANDTSYVDALINLKKVKHVKVNADTITNLSIANSHNDGYLSVLSLMDTAVEYAYNFPRMNNKKITESKANYVIYLTELTNLRKAGAHLDCTFVYCFSKTEARDKEFINGLHYLISSGIDVDGMFMRTFTTEQRNNPAYFDNLVQLKRSDYSSDRDYYVKALERHDIHLDESAKMFLSFKKINDSQYFDSLVRLEDRNVKVDWCLISELSVEKARSYVYMDAIFTLKSKGVKIDCSVIENFSIEDAHDSKKIQEYANKHKI